MLVISGPEHFHIGSPLLFSEPASIFSGYLLCSCPFLSAYFLSPYPFLLNVLISECFAGILVRAVTGNILGGNRPSDSQQGYD